MIKIEITNTDIISIKNFNTVKELKNYLEKKYPTILDEWDYNHLINYGWCENTTFDLSIKIIPNKE